MAGKKGKAGGGTSQGSNDAGRGSSAASGGGQPARGGGRGGQQASASARQAGSSTGGQPASANARQKPASNPSTGGRGGQQAGTSGRQKPASGQGGTRRSSGKGKGRSSSGPAGVFMPKRLLRAIAALSLRAGPIPPQRPELARPSLPGIALLQRIGQLSPGTKIVTGQINWPGRLVHFDFDMEGSEVTSCTRELALCLLSTALQPEHGGSVTVRCFTEEMDPATELPIKELHGFYLGGGQAKKSSPEELEWCHNTCCIDGTPLDPEPAVRYC